MSKKIIKNSRQLDLLENFGHLENATWKPPTYSTNTNLLSPAKITPVYDTYWYFAAERQNVFYNRLRRTNGPWTLDPILTEYKFTNAYRASDRVSQYLIRNVIYRNDLPKTETEIFFRIILFKLFNKIETWEFLEKELGPITHEDYDFKRYDAALMRLKISGHAIYSGAYIMHPGSSFFGHKLKHQNHLKLLEKMIREHLPKKIANTKRMQEGFELLIEYPTIGSFLGYQLVTDLNYSEIVDYSEMEFVVPGPGALDGISKCFTDLGGLNTAEIIKLVADRQDMEFDRLELNFENLWGRKLQLIDCQNLFCEISKYSRVSHPDIAGISSRKRIKQNFRPNFKIIEYWFPPKWGLNSRDLS